MSFFPSVSLFLILLLSITPSPSSALKCYSCENNCADNHIPLVQCRTKDHCVSYQVDRYRVIRGCLSDTTLSYKCTVEAQARMLCQLCNHADGCNMEEVEPLICRSCDWTMEKTCPVRQRCHIPFGTHYVQCYTVYSRLWGFHYGCTFEAPNEVEAIIKNDTFSIVHRKCDAHDCNEEVTFLPVESMFDVYRFCYGCDRGDCGQINCLQPYHPYGMFCYRDQLLNKSGCLSDLFNPLNSSDPPKSYNIQMGFLGGQFLICSTNWCNKDLKSTLICNDQTRNISCSTPGQECVSFKPDDSEIYLPLGCNFNAPCYDRKRCYFCHDKDVCNDKEISQSGMQSCYLCKDESGCKRIRNNQMMFTGFCFNSNCTWSTNGTHQERGCETTLAPSGWNETRICKTAWCNQFPTTAVCYGCQENSRECVYSQLHMNMVSCRPGTESCFVHDRGDGRVERGCGSREAEGAENCHNSTLCNGGSTVTHACHVFETDFDFEMKMKPPVVGTQFAMGWTPDVCADVDGRPACYMSYHPEGMVWGCIGDLRYYKERYYGAEPSDTFLTCEGHYCNYLP